VDNQQIAADDNLLNDTGSGTTRGKFWMTHRQCMYVAMDYFFLIIQRFPRK
jgi:hypothetical protein